MLNRIKTAVLCALFLVFNFFCAYAEEKMLTLAEVLSVTMEKQSDILISKLSIDAAEGARLSAASAFDTKVKASASVRSSETPYSDFKSTVYGVPSEEKSQRDISLSATKTLRSGVVVSTDASASSVDDKTFHTPDENTRTLGFSLSVPWYDIVEGNAYDLREKAAVKDKKSALYTYYYQITTGVFGTMQVWWNYLAAYESMTVYRKAKESMYSYLQDYKKLVDGGERPQADLNQLEAKYRYAVMEANAAESGFRTAGYNLCSAAGAVCGDIMSKNPSAVWPDFDRIMAEASLSAESRRFDILSAEVAMESRQLVIDALKRGKKPEIGLSFSYYQTENDGNTGASMMTGLDFSMPVENSSAKGALLQQFASYRQSRIRLDELRRSAGIDSDNARSELVFAYESLKMAQETVKLYEKAYATEKRKQSLEMSTVLDVVNTADSLRDALLQKIEYARQAAAAAARYAYVSGRIVNVENGTASVNTEFLP